MEVNQQFTSVGHIMTLFVCFKSISHASFEQNAAVLACLAVRYIHKGIEGFKSSNAYLARNNCDERNLVLEDIPNGSLVCIIKHGLALTRL